MTAVPLYYSVHESLPLSRCVCVYRMCALRNAELYSAKEDMGKEKGALVVRVKGKERRHWSISSALPVESVEEKKTVRDTFECKSGLNQDARNTEEMAGKLSADGEENSTAWSIHSKYKTFRINQKIRLTFEVNILDLV